MELAQQHRRILEPGDDHLEQFGQGLVVLVGEILQRQPLGAEFRHQFPAFAQEGLGVAVDQRAPNADMHQRQAPGVARLDNARGIGVLKAGERGGRGQAEEIGDFLRGWRFHGRAFPDPAVGGAGPLTSPCW